MLKSRLRAYYRITKPGIVYGNAIHIIAGYLLSYRAGLSWEVFIGVLSGVSILIASACVANNYLDRHIDAQMARTQQRELVIGKIGVWQALVYAVVLGLVAMIILYTTTNLLTCVLGGVAYVWYVWVYGYAKRTTWLSTIVGAVPGALPIMAGYTAGTNSLDTTAWLLFVLLVLWQLPHFYAIAVMRKKEYAKAGLPIITSRWPVGVVRYHSIVITILYLMAIIALGISKGIQYVGIIAMTLAALYWLFVIVSGYARMPERVWAKRTFLLSLILPIILLAASIATVVLA